MNKKQTITIIVLVATLSSISTVFAVGGSNIIFKTFDGITSHEVMRITSDQKVGIGTSTPSQTLDVAGNMHLSGKLNCNGCVNSTNLANGLSGSTGPTGATGPKGDPGSGVVPAQQCSIGKIVVGFDSQNNAICQSIKLTPDKSNTVDSGPGDVGRYTSIKIGTDGSPVISYYDNTNHTLKLVHCTNTSCSTHDTPRFLDNTGDVGAYSSLAIGTDGFPVISYYDGTNRFQKLVHCTNTSCSTHDTPRMIDSVGDIVSFSSIAIGKDGFPVISYFNGTNSISPRNQTLKLVHCTNIACNTNDPPRLLDNMDDVGYYSSIAIGTDGFPVISSLDSTHGHLKLVHCTNTSCSTHDGSLDLDTCCDAGFYTSIAIGTDGFPVISYQDGSNTINNQALRLVHCTSISCSTRDTPRTFDVLGNDGYFTSITIGTDGFPAISYYDVPNGFLKLVHCTNTSCSTHDTIKTLDSNGNVGQYTSITIGIDGAPVISYYDVTNHALKVWRGAGITLS